MFDSVPNPIGGLPFFDRLSEKARSGLLQKARVRRFVRGTTICLQGEPATSLKVVLDGWVKLYHLAPDGGEAVLTTLSSGRSFDELAALNGGCSQLSAEAVSDCSLVLLDLSSIRACEEASREIGAIVLSAVSGHLDEMIDQVAQLKAKTGAQRLSGYLAELSGIDTGAAELSLPFDKSVLAARLGMKPESLSRVFNQLRGLGVTHRLKRIRIEDVSALKAFAQDSSLAIGWPD
jgi:CRP-like cAMP-binding protein